MQTDEDLVQAKIQAKTGTTSVPTHLLSPSSPSRVVIDRIDPMIDGGRFPAMRHIDERVEIRAVLLTDGHERLKGRLLWRHEEETEWFSVPLVARENDEWIGTFQPTRLGRHLVTVEASMDRTGARFVRYGCEVPIQIEPALARFSSWYEFFPRSTSAEPGRHGTFRDAEKFLEHAREMGFDVVYLPPIHPIGRSFRKGKNNALAAAEEDVGSPWAIGAAEGGHKDVHPHLGTMADFERFLARARSLGLEVAMDIAFQCAPDHPYVREHPEWFRKRPDGTIQCAENPPKKYQDIYPFDFECAEWRALWRELKSVVGFWVERGVRVFRVDNPHTKPFHFWEWLIREIRSARPDVIFLAEAFTRPHVMAYLAKAGFSQSYTYFAWRNTKWELTQYLTELTQPPLIDTFGANFWPNTPDILPEPLTGNVDLRAVFTQRLILAATLSSSYGIYGPVFELMEHQPREEGSEEYLDSEKYQLRHWDLERPTSLAPLIQRVNRIRRERRALQNNRTLRFHPVTNDQLIAYSKSWTAPTAGAAVETERILVVVNLDPHHVHSGLVELPLFDWGIDPSETFQVHDLLTDARYFWTGWRNYVELNPHSLPAHVFVVRRRMRNAADFDYFA